MSPQPETRPARCPCCDPGRAALFVDGGWLLAAIAQAVLGSTRRVELSCEYRSLLDSLAGYVDSPSEGTPRLRTCKAVNSTLESFPSLPQRSGIGLIMSAENDFGLLRQPPDLERSAAT